MDSAGFTPAGSPRPRRSMGPCPAAISRLAAAPHHGPAWPGVAAFV